MSETKKNAHEKLISVLEDIKKEIRDQLIDIKKEIRDQRLDLKNVLIDIKKELKLSRKISQSYVCVDQT